MDCGAGRIEDFRLDEPALGRERPREDEDKAGDYGSSPTSM
jgi:hypothetical protein